MPQQEDSDPRSSPSQVPSTRLSSRYTRPQHARTESYLDLTRHQQKTRALATAAMPRQDGGEPHSGLSQTPSTCSSSRCTRPQHGRVDLNLWCRQRKTRARATAAMRWQDSDDLNSILPMTIRRLLAPETKIVQLGTGCRLHLLWHRKPCRMFQRGIASMMFDQPAN